MSLTRFILFRLLQMLLVIVGTVTVIFVVLYVLVPGDAAEVLLGSRATPERLQSLRQELGLDRPLWAQYGSYLWRLAHFDFGTSYELNRSVSSVILDYLPATAWLATAALLLEAVLGIGWGVLTVYRRSPRLAALSNVTGALLLAVPVFFLGLLLQYFFASRLGLLPLSGLGDFNPLYLVLPAVTLGAAQVAILAAVMRSSLDRETGKAYMLAARARGLSGWQALTRHGLRNSLAPVVTLLLIDFGSLLGGAMVTEVVFSWPGLGRMTFNAAGARDVPLITGIALFLVVVFVIINTLADLIYGLLDPRVRRGGRIWQATRG